MKILLITMSYNHDKNGTDNALHTVRSKFYNEEIMKTTKAILVFAAALLLLLYPVSSKADTIILDTFNFVKITNNGNPSVGGQLSVQVIDPDVSGGTDVMFKFFNNVGITSSITQIYFDDGSLLEISAITYSGAGVAFTKPATPGNLPGANLVSPAFVTTDQFSAGSDPPTVANGVSTFAEWVAITFNLQDGKAPDDVIDALRDGSLRIGLHVQGYTTVPPPPSLSESYVNTVPEPGILILLGIAMSAIGVASWKISKL